MILNKIKTITHGDYPELGTPTGLFSNRDNTITAVSCNFNHLYLPQRMLYVGQHLLYRASIYDVNGQRIALCDNIRYPINDIAIHPTLPLIAIACGRYDGGYFYEGELLIFNMEDMTIFSTLLESREVTRCRFNETGNELIILIRPQCDEDFDWDYEKTTNTFFGCSFQVNNLKPAPPRDPLIWRSDPRLEELNPIEPSELGFDSGVIQQENPVSLVEKWAASHGKKFTEQHHVWDLAWLSGDNIAAIHSNCLVELFSTQEEYQSLWSLPMPHIQDQESCKLESTQLHYTIHTNELKINVINHTLSFPPQYYSTIYTVDMTGTNKGGSKFTIPLTLSWNKDDYCLAINTNTDEHVSYLINLNNETLPHVIGHYDCANHYLRIDKGNELFYLRGASPTSFEKKFLYSLNPINNTQHRLWSVDTTTNIWQCLWPFNQQDKTKEHTMHLDGCLINNERIILSWITYDPNPYKVSGYIACRNLKSGRFIWKQPITAQTSAISYVESANIVICLLVNGTIHIYDIETGALIESTDIIIDNIPTVPLSIAVYGNSIAIGTMDGRIVIYRVDK